MLLQSLSHLCSPFNPRSPWLSPGSSPLSSARGCIKPRLSFKFFTLSSNILALWHVSGPVQKLIWILSTSVPIDFVQGYTVYVSWLGVLSLQLSVLPRSAYCIALGNGCHWELHVWLSADYPPWAQFAFIQNEDGRWWDGKNYRSQQQSMPGHRSSSCFQLW